MRISNDSRDTSKWSPSSACEACHKRSLGKPQLVTGKASAVLVNIDSWAEALVTALGCPGYEQVSYLHGQD